jgi:hypothetical protein
MVAKIINPKERGSKLANPVLKPLSEKNLTPEIVAAYERSKTFSKSSLLDL